MRTEAGQAKGHSAAPFTAQCQERVPGFIVPGGANWRDSEKWNEGIKAHLWANTAVFHWACFIALMKANGEQVAEDATWQGSRAAKQPPADAERKLEVGK